MGTALRQIEVLPLEVMGTSVEGMAGQGGRDLAGDLDEYPNWYRVRIGFR